MQRAGLISTVFAGCLVAACAVQPASTAPRASGEPASNSTSPDFTAAHVVNEYSAASGRKCREYTVGADKETHLACTAGHGWVEIRPLIRADRAASSNP